MRRFREWMSVQIAKNPGRVVLLGILSFNIVFFLIAAIIISNLSLEGTESMNFFEAAFCTIAMILDPGCIEFVIGDIGQTGVAITIVCLVVVFVGMISFTGAVIGYTTNYISDFITNANAGARRLNISDHVVILNWNTRASEIINDLLYCETKQKVVVLVSAHKAEIEREIYERLSDTVERENEELSIAMQESNGRSKKYGFAKRFTQRITVIVREGDVFSSKQLQDISLDKAKSVIILGNDKSNSICSYRSQDYLDDMQKGNSLTIKTLMQVADITSASTSADHQKIIVEITDDWTWDLVSKIIEYKEVKEKCNIVPVRVNKVLGQLLSQFSLMPELNMVYRELFSNKGMAFYSVEVGDADEERYVSEYLSSHGEAVPLSFMTSDGRNYCYFATKHEKLIHKTMEIAKSSYRVDFNHQYWMSQKNVIILGHNSKITSIMDGFLSFRSEWGYKDTENEILKLMVIDDAKNLERMNHYVDYPFVVETVSADIYERDIICSAIDRFVSGNAEDTSILILSDDSVVSEEIDAGALANLVYVQDIIHQKKLENPNFDEQSMDVIVEIIDPKHHDIVSNYSVNNVVISNRYISKMITQVGEKEGLFEFYTDILTYDDSANDGGYESKEIYTKRVKDLFHTIPEKCSAEELIRAVYFESINESLPSEQRNPTLVIGYINADRGMVLFGDRQRDIDVELQGEDLLIVFSNH